MEETQKRPIPQPGAAQPTENSYEYAGFWRRLTAFYVDSLALSVIGITISVLLGTNPFEPDFSLSITWIDTGLTILAVFCYTVLFWAWSDGATPGKKLLGVKIIKTSGQSIGFGTAIGRYLSYILSRIPFGLGFMWIGWDSKKQGWHDKIASTYVIKTGGGNMAIGIILAIIALLYSISIFSYSFYQGFMSGIEEYKQESSSSSSVSLSTPKDFQDSMDPEVKELYDQSEDLFDQMRQAQQSEDVATIIALNDENITILKKATELDPKNPLLWSSLGNAYTWRSTNGTLEDMLDAYQKAEALDPDNPVLINNVGDALIYLGRYEDAILQFQKTFRLTDNSGYANLSIARAYQELGITDDAQKHYEEAIVLFEKQNKNGTFDSKILEAKKALSEL